MRPRPFSRLVSVSLAVALAGIAVALAVRVTGLGSGIWPITPLIAFTLYLVPLSVALAGVAAVAREWRVAAGLVACGGVAALIAVPRARPNDQPAASGQTVRVTSANLLRGQADPAEIAAIVRRRQTDVLAIQELTMVGWKRLERGGAFAELPHLLRARGRKWNDAAIASRWPLTRVEVPGLPSVYVVADARLPDGRTVRVLSAHPTPPVRPEAQARWEDWLDAFPAPRAVGMEAGIAAGDFNATEDHRQFRRMLDLGWRDVASELGEGLRPTWDSRRYLPLTLDHVLVPPGAAARAYAIDELPGSDHRAISATVVLPAIPAG